MPSEKLLVCDLDNTLYDWVSYFVPSFYAMVDKVVEITGCEKERLLDDFREVHRAHGDSEQPFALLETSTIKELYKGRSLASVLRELDPAFHAFNSARKKNLKLHATVRETLERIDAAGFKIVAHTESKLYGAIDRLYRLDLVRYFSGIYCRERSPSSHPNPKAFDAWIERIPTHLIVELSHHQTKPDPAVLSEICVREGVQREHVFYVGDSMARDILMAKRAGVSSIWAAYGAKHDPNLYRQLVRISHWTPEEVSRELALNEEAKNIQPDFVAQYTFAEVSTPLGIDLPRRLAAN